MPGSGRADQGSWTRSDAWWNRVWRNERRDLAQPAASESLPQHCEPPALIIVQPKPPAAQLRLQYTVLLAEEGDHVALLGPEPAKQTR